MAAIVLQTASNHNGGGATTLDLTFAAAPTSGNLMVAAISVRGGSGVTITPPTGWTLLRRIDQGTTLSLAIYTRLNQAGAVSVYSWTFSAAQKASGGIREIAGQRETSPVAIENGGVNASATTHTTVAVTVPTGPHLLSASFGTATGTTGTEAAGWTEGYDQATSGGSAGTRTTSEGQSRDHAGGASVSGSVVWGAAAVGASHIMAIAPAPVAHPLTGAITATSATAGSLAIPMTRKARVFWAEVETPAAVAGVHPLTGAITATSATAATRLVMDQPLAGAVVGTSATAGSFAAAAGAALSGAAAGTSATVATALAMDRPLAGASTATSTANASTLTLNHPLAGSVTATSTTAATSLSVGHDLSGGVSGTSETAGSFADT
ncbi:MAG: hypothetical protein M3440_06915, partial [Chloroflexota bacterium]|nr:hypothetical protein [Chloroflexota bacterium]